MRADPWVLVDPGALAAGCLELPPEEGRHLAKVLRQTVGATVTACDGRGTVATAAVRAVRRDRVEVEVLDLRPAEPMPSPAVDLALGVLHTAAMDWAVQKAVEVGVRSFTPVVGGRTQGGDRAARRRLEHWRRIARQALKQCRRGWEMELREPVPMRGLTGAEAGRTVLLADRDGVHVGEAVRRGDVLLVVGPEGGFDRDEAELASEMVWARVCLGPFVLRAETAAIVGTALIRAELSAPAAGDGAGSSPPGSRYTLRP